MTTTLDGGHAAELYAHISGDAELTREECGTQFGQHSGNLATRWAVACRHRTTRKGGVGGGQCTAQCNRVNAHSVMPFVSKSPS